MIWSNMEYVALRIIRRFLFTGAVLDRMGGWMPYWRVNQGRLDPEPIVTAWLRLAREAGPECPDLRGKRVAELGCGATNGTGYEWTSRLGGRWTGVEPFEPFDADRDERIFQQVSWRQPAVSRMSVSRVRSLDALETGSMDIIVSNSVLEHIRDPFEALRQCHRVLAAGGVMLHQVDYRDHFFKYPFHFLTFSQGMWDNLLDPGDLPRHRLDDHLFALRQCGFETRVLERQTDHEALAAVAPFLDPAFASRDRDMLATTTAAIFCRKSA